MLDVDSRRQGIFAEKIRLIVCDINPYHHYFQITRMILLFSRHHVSIPESGFFLVQSSPLCHVLMLMRDLGYTRISLPLSARILSPLTWKLNSKLFFFLSIVSWTLKLLVCTTSTSHATILRNSLPELHSS